MANYSEYPAGLIHKTYCPPPPPPQLPMNLDHFPDAKISAIEWEDEKTYCFQVELRGFTIARRKDTNMINGTKLLNFVGMTRGKRDGILKNEPGRVVIKSGSMILKGVWLPLPRAIELAKEYRIYDTLYPLFEDDIQSFFYSPVYSTRSTNPGWDNQFQHHDFTSVISPFNHTSYHPYHQHPYHQHPYHQHPYHPPPPPPPQHHHHYDQPHLGLRNYQSPSVDPTPLYYEPSPSPSHPHHHPNEKDSFPSLSTNSSYESYHPTYPRSGPGPGPGPGADSGPGSLAPNELTRANSDSEVHSFPLSQYPSAPLGYSYYSN